jgi:hypothetical protein
VKPFCLLIYIFLLSACSINTQYLPDPIKQIKLGNFDIAEASIKQKYSKQGKNKLLYFLELGMLEHLRGNFTKSNQYLTNAEKILEDSYTVSLSDKAAELFTGSRFSNYQGYDFESTLVTYYKALNYFSLKVNQSNYHISEFDPTLVEIRRLGLKLGDLTHKTGGYQSNEQVSINVNNTGNNLEGKISHFIGQLLTKRSQQQIGYKDDAYAHYSSAVFYEMAGEYDSARIEYQKAAKIYESGFSKQSPLSQETTQQAWFDTVRIMKTHGGYPWHDLAQEKLSKTQQQQLQKYTTNTSELIVVQHAGNVNQKQTLNLLLSFDQHSRSLVLNPVITGNLKQRQDQYTWFAMLYADTDLLDIIENYMLGDLSTVVAGAFTKRIPLYGNLLDSAQSLGLLAALERPVRIAVPFYPTTQQNIKYTDLYIDGEKQRTLIQTQSINHIALQEQLSIADNQIQFALIKELVKAITTQKITEELGADLGAFAKVGLTLLNIATGSADTRNWLTLPAEIRLARIPLPAGTQNVTLKTYFSSGRVIEQNKTVIMTKGKPQFWYTHTYKNASDTTLKTNNSN